MAAVVNWQIPVFHVFPFFAPCIAIFSTMRYPSATSSTIITLKPTAKKHRADVRVPPLRHFRDQRQIFFGRRTEKTFVLNKTNRST